VLCVSVVLAISFCLALHLVQSQHVSKVPVSAHFRLL